MNIALLTPENPVHISGKIEAEKMYKRWYGANPVTIILTHSITTLNSSGRVQTVSDTYRNKVTSYEYY